MRLAYEEVRGYWRKSAIEIKGSEEKLNKFT
jgi:hypothetical protein